MSDETPHPAKFSAPVLELIAGILDERDPQRGTPQLRRGSRGAPVLLDPFAGVGKIHELTKALPWLTTIGVELEPEWARQHDRTYVGDATKLLIESDSVDVVATSPCYGNRMADTYDGKGLCRACAGVGRSLSGPEPTPVEVTCPRCKGTGRDVSSRMTYRTALGRMPSTGSSSTLQWGEAYKDLHRKAIGEMRRVVRPGGIVMVNMSNHIRRGVEQDVVGWWEQALTAEGFEHRQTCVVSTRRYRHGQNHEARINGERLIIVDAPGGRRTPR